MTVKKSRKRVASVREYLASKPKECRASLEAVRRAILNALPKAQEGLAYQIPAYTLNGVGVLYFAGGSRTTRFILRAMRWSRRSPTSWRRTNAARGRSSSRCPSRCPSA
jgi:hypothetical protein